MLSIVYYICIKLELVIFVNSKYRANSSQTPEMNASFSSVG